MEKFMELKRERYEYSESETKKYETIFYEEDTDWIRESICNSYQYR